MAFKLNRVIDGEEKLFLLRKLLEVLGDPINDEISLDGEAYRISSFISLNTSDGFGQLYLWYSIELLVTELSQETFTLPEPISETNSLLLFINGVNYNYGSLECFHLSDNNLIWHGGFELEASDTILLKYQKSVN